jgi:hypothetical protein
MRALRPGWRFSASHKPECAKLREPGRRSDTRSDTHHGTSMDASMDVREQFADAANRDRRAFADGGCGRRGIAGAIRRTKKTARVSAGGVRWMRIPASRLRGLGRGRRGGVLAQ